MPDNILTKERPIYDDRWPKFYRPLLIPIIGIVTGLLIGHWLFG